MQVTSKELKMITLKTYNDSKLTQLDLYPIQFIPDPILTQILNWIPPDPNHTWPMPDSNRVTVDNPKQTRSKLHLNRTRIDPNTVLVHDPNPNFTRIELNPTRTWLTLKWSKLDSNLNPTWTQLTQKWPKLN